MLSIEFWRTSLFFDKSCLYFCNTKPCDETEVDNITIFGRTEKVVRSYCSVFTAFVFPTLKIRSRSQWAANSSV